MKPNPKYNSEPSRSPKRPRSRLYDDELPAASYHGAVIPYSEDTKRTGDDGLSNIERRFIHFFRAEGRNIEVAAVKAGYAPTSAYERGCRLMRQHRIKKALAVLDAESLRRQNLDIDAVVRGQYIRATASVTECYDIIVPPCRFCWGINHLYQRTHAEMEKDFEEYNTQPIKRNRDGSERPKPPFDEKGGAGYNIHREPNPDCPNCFGLPHPDRQPIFLPKEDHLLTPEARMLLAGAVSKNGVIELKFRDQDAAAGQFLTTFRELMQLRKDDEGGMVLDMQPSRSSGTGLVPRFNAVRRIIVRPKDEGE